MWTILEHPAAIGILVAIPSFVLGWLGFRRSVKADRVAQQSGAATFQLGAVDQIINGLNELVDNLQADNKMLREGLVDLSARLKEIVGERDALALELKELRKSYGGTGG